MKETALLLLICATALGFLFTSPMPSTFAQSQALNGQIEGTVLDQSNEAVPDAVITVTNIETGATRNMTTDESGTFRFPLLPLGTYRITAEAANFKKLVREGVTLTIGSKLKTMLTLSPKLFSRSVKKQEAIIHRDKSICFGRVKVPDRKPSATAKAMAATLSDKIRESVTKARWSLRNNRRRQIKLRSRE